MVSEMGLSPDHWGPYVWAAIHLICLGAPDTLDASQQQAYRSFFNQLPYVIPCSTCANHLRENLSKVPIDNALTGNKELFAWSVKLHNLVNMQLKKPEVSLEDATTHWSSTCINNGPQACVGQNKEIIRVNNVSLSQKLIILFVGILIGSGFIFGLQKLLNKGRGRN